MVYVIHDQGKALTMSDRIAVFNDGKIQQLARPADLYERPDNSFVAGFIDENKKLPGVIEELNGDMALVRLATGELIDATAVNAREKGHKTLVSIRPERVEFKPEMPYRRLIMALLISPKIVPIIIAVGMSFFYAKACVVPDSAMNLIFGAFLSEKGGLANSHLGVIVAHAVLGIPFVIITVTATLSGFDQSLIRAAHSLGANPRTTYFKVVMQLILPGIISGALFAFVTSFDEVAAVLFIAGPDQQTIPHQMFYGIREAISPAILAVATILVIISVLLLTTVELLRRRSERLRGVTPR